MLVDDPVLDDGRDFTDPGKSSVTQEACGKCLLNKYLKKRGLCQIELLDSTLVTSSLFGKFASHLEEFETTLKAPTLVAYFVPVDS